MILTYYFGRYDDEEFEYETDGTDFIQNLELKDVIPLAEFLLDEDNKLVKNLASEYNIKSVKDIDITTDDGKEFIYYLLHDYAEPKDIVEVYEDDLLDYYRADAYEAYEDSKLSAWEYNGVHVSDFI